ncbi:MAG: peptide-methionine (S)-S-oxide reductase MsrA [Albidovulum sp.]|nr:peptide-methionine (S)-S-oxide reductase MsrA [Albidovulum sp.]
MRRAFGTNFAAGATRSLAAFFLGLFTLASSSGAATETAVFAGGCFWCVESDFDRVDGVLETVSGYTGGTTEDPTYRQVTRGGTGHLEAVQVTFDPDKVSYKELVDLYWRSVDPTDDGGQFCDRGHSYSTAVFVSGDRQRMAAEASLASAQKALGMAIVTPIRDAAEFYTAEDKHQDYYLGSNLVITRFGIIPQSDAYKRYRKGCGRDARVFELWGEDAPFIN